MIQRSANGRLFIDVIRHKEICPCRIELRVVHITDRRFQIVAVFVGNTDAILPALNAAVHRRVDRLAGVGGVHTGTNLALHRFCTAFLRDDVERTANSVGTVKHRCRSFDDFNAFNHGRIDQNG